MQFLQANAGLIFFGLALVFMMWMHGGGGQHSGMGGGCGMGHEDHGAHEHDLQQIGPPVQGVKPEPSDPAEPIASATHTSGRGAGCH